MSRPGTAVQTGALPWMSQYQPPGLARVEIVAERLVQCPVEYHLCDSELFADAERVGTR